MKCPKCGANIPDTAKFCTSCGVNISESLAEMEEVKAEIEENKVVEEKISEFEKIRETIVEPAAEEKKEEIVNEPEIEEKDEKQSETSKETDNAKFTKKVEKSGKKKKKKHTGLKVILVLILILLLLVAGCYGLYKLDVLPDSMSSVFEKVEGFFEKENDSDDESDKKDEKKEKKKEQNTVSNTVIEEKKCDKIDDDEEIVFDAIDKVIGGNKYKVPTINIDSIYAKNCNSEMKKYVEEEIKLYEKATKLPNNIITTCNYYWALNDNILSVVFFIGKADIDEYHVYNIDINTGERIINSEILEAAKINDYIFAENGSEAMKDFFEHYAFDSSIIKDKTSSEYKEAYENSTGRGNFDRYMDMFLNKNGELCVIAKVSIPGKTKTDNTILNIENRKRNSKQIFEGTNFPIKSIELETEIDNVI